MAFGEGQPRPTDPPTTSNDAGQLGSLGIPPDQNDHTEEPTVVTTDETTKSTGISESNNDQDNQSGIVTAADDPPNNPENNNDNTHTRSYIISLFISNGDESYHKIIFHFISSSVFKLIIFFSVTLK